MKKIVVLLVVAAMMFSLAGTAFAADLFSDVTDQTVTTKNAITKLNALNIIDGYPDGTFKPSNTITRAEFAKIAVVAAGLKDSAEVLKNASSQFSDVKAGEWHTGWINLAAAQGFVKGYPNGTFNPKAEISYSESVTVLLRILGYNDNLPGPWPVDYIAKAGALEITEDVTFDAKAPATRGDITVMAAATLDADVVKYDKDDEDFVDKYSPSKTLLADKFDGNVVEDAVVTDWKVNSDDEYEVKIGSDWFVVAENGRISGANVIADVVNATVDYIYDTNDEEIDYINITSTVVIDDEIEVDNTKKEVEIEDVEYDFADATATFTVASEAIYKVYLNEDNEVYAIEAVTYADPEIVDEYDSNKETLKYKPSGTLDVEDKDVLVVKNGAYATLADIAENDLVYVDNTVSGLDYYIEAFSVAKSGKLDATYATAIKVDGVKYDLATGYEMSRDAGDELETTPSFTDVYGETIKFALDKNENVFYVIADVDAADSSEMYGIVTEIVDKNTIKNLTTKVKIFTEKGVEAVYSIDTDEVEVNYGTGDVDKFVKFSVNEAGAIDELEVLTADKAVTNADKDSNRIYVDSNWYFVNENTVVLNANYTDADDDIEAGLENISDLLDYAETNDFNVYFEADGNTIEYIIIDESISVSGDYALITDIYTVDGDAMVDVDIEGVVKTYEVGTGTPVEDKVFAYTVSNGKINIGTEVAPASTGTVTDVVISRNAVEIDGYLYMVNEDTVIYDFSDDDPVFVEDLSGVSEDDEVKFSLQADEKDIIEFLFIQ